MIRKNQAKSASCEHIDTANSQSRILEWLPLAPPDYLINPTHLIDSFVEFECIYEGTLKNVPTDLDLKRRTDVLKIVDVGHSLHTLASPSTKCILSLSAHNIKLNNRLPPEILLLRIPLEEVISVASIRDNALHYIAILHNTSITDSSVGSLTMLIAETNIRADEICCLISQCFQILYTEATLRHFDRQLYSSISHSGRDYPPVDYLELNKFKENHHESIYDEEKTLAEIESVYSELSASKADLLQNYMVQLQQVLSKEEMKEFALSLTAWKKGSSFESFCRKTRALLGPDRITLLADMKYFIDPADKFTLKQFINDSNSPTKSLSPKNHWSQLLAKSPFPYPMQRTISYASTSNGVLSIYDEDNSLRDDYSSPMKNNMDDKSDLNGDDEFSKNIDTLFQKIEDLDLILSSDG